MKELEKTELLEIQGGLKFSASLLSSVVRGVNNFTNSNNNAIN